MNEQNRNLLLATALSFLVILVWFVLFPPPEPTVDPTLPPGAPQTQASDLTTAAPPAAAPTEGGAATQAAPGAAEAVADIERIEIETPELRGSVSLLGGRIDDLALKSYRETLDESSPNVTLLSPVGNPQAYYALYGWAAGEGVSPENVPGPNTLWQLESGTKLTPANPIVLSWDNGAGLVFRREIAVDDQFMFRVTQSVSNTGAAPATLAPYGIVARHGEPDTIGFFILHEGVVRVSDGELQEIDYGNLRDLDFDPREGARAETVQVAENGWIGFTDKNWMTTLVPEPGTSFRSIAKFDERRDIYQIDAVLPTRTIAPGESTAAETMLFAGAKEWEAIRDYQRGGIDRFIDSIDWGWFFFLTKPIFWVLHELNILIGNMGWSIIALTVLIKMVLLPLAYKSYVSMARMKELQPEMEKLKEKAGDDRQKLQQGMMELYKKNKVNPAAGCLPILLQIPIFFSLYKVIFVTIELRHAPWLGPFQDLSAPDPTSILNLFGLLPFAAPDPTSIVALIFIGILPLVLGISMWLQQKLNPAPTDPTQQMIFAWMPWVFMFMLGGFASGLILYWITNNVLTFMQQYAIMRSHGYTPDVFGNIRSSFQRQRKADNK